MQVRSKAPFLFTNYGGQSEDRTLYCLVPCARLWSAALHIGYAFKRVISGLLHALVCRICCSNYRGHLRFCLSSYLVRRAPHVLCGEARSSPAFFLPHIRVRAKANLLVHICFHRGESTWDLYLVVNKLVCSVLFCPPYGLRFHLCSSLVIPRLCQFIQFDWKFVDHHKKINVAQYWRLIDALNNSSNLEAYKALRSSISEIPAYHDHFQNDNGE
ncbi:hypothetical protein BC936DRAFT_140856 [Jimgerdemannia flammicorona]|uniref:Uncharacterized protein n=1 Tax=Jimgerdemannia flammicorona TaxID=994334 RepID=A0A433A3B4_9FUNG|nr:hypothetical protein BC936DRAFT_140856 [Jimgerdemannia flammicorona]